MARQSALGHFRHRRHQVFRRLQAFLHLRVVLLQVFHPRRLRAFRLRVSRLHHLRVVLRLVRD